MCQRCSSERVFEVGGKCSDMFQAYVGEHKHDGYVPGDMGIGRGDYVEFRYCADCGQVQGTFPLPLTKLEKE